ncbi:MAG: sulfatase [Phycisphaeraceae bacterium]
MARTLFTFIVALVCISHAALSLAADAPAKARPNIVWIFVDDMSANFGCYGEKTIKTPVVDQLAADGSRFSHAYVTAPVCSANRSALITGMYQTTIGAHHHRSGRGKEKIHLPQGVVPVPVLFQKAGYFTTITSWPISAKNAKARGKTDYNFQWDAKMYDHGDWRARAKGQPFFTQIQLPGGKLRGGGRMNPNIIQKLGSATSPDDVTLAPYYPRDPVLLGDWAAYLDSCRETDRVVGEILDRLKEDGLLDTTYVFFMTDHGISHARGKQFLYDEGMHVPFIIKGPGIAKGAVRSDLVEHIDMTATSLALAGIEIPSWMQGRDILAKDYKERDAVFAARDRCDETVEGIRAVRTQEYKYIRNFYPDRPMLQPNNYKDNKPILITLRKLHDAGKLTALQDKLLFAPTRAHEELYDLKADPFELNNLAGDPAHRDTLLKLRARLDEWMKKTDDKGRLPESDAMYDSDMAEYVGGRGGKGDSQTEKNIALMKKWAIERPMKVNP